MRADSVPGGDSSPVLRRAASRLCPHAGKEISGVSSYKDATSVGLELHPYHLIEPPNET